MLLFKIYNRRNKKNSSTIDELANLPLELTNVFKDIKDVIINFKDVIIKNFKVENIRLNSELAEIEKKVNDFFYKFDKYTLYKLI